MKARISRTASARPDIDRLPDQEMADVEFDDLRQGRDRLGGLEVEAVPGMNLEPGLPRQHGAFADAQPLGFRRFHPLFGERVAPGAGVDFDHRRAHGCGGLDLPRLGGDEQRHADAGLAQLRDPRHQRGALARDVEPALGGALLAPLRHQAGGMRPGLDRDAHHLVGRRHFEIERLGDLRLKARHVVVADVAAILAQMRGDAVGAGLDRDLGGADRIGMRPPRALRTVATWSTLTPRRR